MADMCLSRANSPRSGTPGILDIVTAPPSKAIGSGASPGACSASSLSARHSRSAAPGLLSR
ncbi:hypothetical protein ACFQQB_30715 [Nonomuraea rubra]|uniref:hypothetical protein n=1 Tax=Nonomuraea rubra TaxID=46180 RepID=UPI003617695F